MNVPNNERRDWSLVIFIIPLGILLIVLVGQFAIRIFPNWSVNANMRSNLDPNAPNQPISFLQPLLPQIMTPMAWAENYLDQNSDFTFPPFFVFEPTATASPSPTTVSPTPTSPSPTATTPSPTTTTTYTPTPTDEDNNPTPSPVSGCTDPDALNYDPLATVDDGSCTYPPPVSGCTDPDALNYDSSATVDDGSCTYPPPVSGCTDPDALNYDSSATVDDGSCTYPPTGSPTTIDPSYGTPAPIPTQINVGGTPDDPGDETGIGQIQDGTYIVLTLSVEVGLTPDANYDLVYYEYNNSGYVYLDWIIIGISNFPDGSNYYEVFNWGDNPDPDTNSNVDTNTLPTPPYVPCDPPEAPECDDHEVDLDDLYDPDGGDNSNSTGVLIDVDTATSEPPPGTYDYVVIIAPNGGSSGGPADIDAIATVEVPISPTP